MHSLQYERWTGKTDLLLTSQWECLRVQVFWDVTLDPWWQRRHIPLKYQEPLTQQHGVTSQRPESSFILLQEPQDFLMLKLWLHKFSHTSLQWELRLYVRNSLSLTQNFIFNDWKFYVCTPIWVQLLKYWMLWYLLLTYTLKFKYVIGTTLLQSPCKIYQITIFTVTRNMSTA